MFEANMQKISEEEFLKIKVITICSSKRFKKEILKCYNQLSNLGKIVLLPVLERDPKKSDTFYKFLQRRKIVLSDAIYVLNKDGYIGEGVREEIEFAKNRDAKILFHEPASYTPLIIEH